jgi:hypothetical protein
MPNETSKSPKLVLVFMGLALLACAGLSQEKSEKTSDAVGEISIDDLLGSPWYDVTFPLEGGIVRTGSAEKLVISYDSFPNDLEEAYSLALREKGWTPRRPDCGISDENTEFWGRNREWIRKVQTDNIVTLDIYEHEQQSIPENPNSYADIEESSLDEVLSEPLHCEHIFQARIFQPDGALGGREVVGDDYENPRKLTGTWQQEGNVLTLKGTVEGGQPIEEKMEITGVWTRNGGSKVLLGAKSGGWDCGRNGETGTGRTSWALIMDGGARSFGAVEAVGWITDSCIGPWGWTSKGPDARNPSKGIEVLYRKDPPVGLYSYLERDIRGVEVTMREWPEAPAPVVVVVGGAPQWRGGLPEVYTAGPFKDISPGYLHTCALSVVGEIRCWGYDGEGQLQAPSGEFEQISTGLYKGCALSKNKTVTCWGKAESPAGQFDAISVADEVVCGLRGQKVECWGGSEFDRDLEHTSAKAISLGYDYGCVLNVIHMAPSSGFTPTPTMAHPTQRRQLGRFEFDAILSP